MALLKIIQPTYTEPFLPYRYANQIEANGISNYNFFYSVNEKDFYFKSDKNALVTRRTVDFLNIDNAFLINNTLSTL